MTGDGRNRPGKLRRWFAENLTVSSIEGFPARFLQWRGRGRRGGANGGLRFARGLLNQRRRARPWELAFGALWGEKKGEESEDGGSGLVGGFSLLHLVSFSFSTEPPALLFPLECNLFSDFIMDAMMQRTQKRKF